MKKLIFTCVCIMFTQMVFAQKDSLQFDESNNYVYYRVVDNANLTVDTLYNRAWDFAVNAGYGKPVKGKADYALNTSGKFLVYAGVSLMRKESGSVSYTINIQAKDQKYRYRIGGFVFTPYKRDRYGNMVPVAGIEIPLEKMTSKYSKKELDSYLDQIGLFCITAGQKLKQVIDRQQAVKKAETPQKISTENW